jgi:hypothetical protein
MIRPLLDLLYGSVAVEWESAYGLEESVARLRAVTKKSAFSVLAEPAAVGTVTQAKVKLQRVLPMVRNSFKPFLIGQFVARGERVFLVGRFTMLGVVKIFMSFWFGCLGIFTIVAIVQAPFHPSAKSGNVALVLGPLAMGAFGVGLVGFGKWLARKDAEWLRAVVQQAISKTANSVLVSSAGPAAPPLAFRGRPTVVIVTVLVLALLGAMNLAIAFAGSFAISGNPFRMMTMYSSGVPRYAMAAQGVFLLAMAVGIYLRTRIAWMAGFVWIAGAWAFVAANAFLESDKMAPPSGVRIAFAVVALLVAFYWGRWWHAQRVHFVA